MHFGGYFPVYEDVDGVRRPEVPKAMVAFVGTAVSLILLIIAEC